MNLVDGRRALGAVTAPRAGVSRVTHELGHILMHMDRIPDGISDIEDEANITKSAAADENEGFESRAKNRHGKISGRGKSQQQYLEQIKNTLRGVFYLCYPAKTPTSTSAAACSGFIALI